MKKKFVLTLALVLMVAVTLSAATPVEVSGNFDYGYEFAFKDGTTITGKSGSDYTTFVAVSSDFWKVTFNAGTAQNVIGEETDIVDATADIYLSKALAAEGVDMGDVGLTLHVGNKVGGTAPTVYANKIDKDGGLKASANGTNLGATIKYADMVDVYVATAVATDDFDTVIGAKFAPVDGVTAAAGFGVDSKTASVSAAADIAALADLDFDLAVTVGYQGVFGDDVTTKIGADVAGEYEGIGLWVGFSTNLDKHSLGAGASYGLEVEGFDISLGVDLSIDDLSDVKVGVGVDASAAYTMSDVTYKLALGWKLDGAFTVTPSISFAF